MSQITKNRILVESALLVALSVILTRFLSIKITFGSVEGVRIGLGVFPTILAGLRLGSWQGGKVGAAADILGYLMSPGGAYVPFFTMISACYGVIPPLLIGKRESASIARIYLSVFLTYFLLNMFATPYVLFLYFGIPYKVLVVSRFLSFLLNTGLMGFMLAAIERTEFRTISMNQN